VEALPDLQSLSDVDLKALIDDLIKQEDEVSYQRRILHGKIDILRAELTARLKQRHEGELLSHVDVDRLTDILVAKGFSPTEAQ
jgi:anti-sigma-K factor RsiG